jgi:hypothetical protein
MKWHCLGFVVPAGLLWVFPEFSLVRCGRPHTMPIDEERDICEFACVHSTGGSEWIVMKSGAY